MWSSLLPAVLLCVLVYFPLPLLAVGENVVVLYLPLDTYSDPITPNGVLGVVGGSGCLGGGEISENPCRPDSSTGPTRATATGGRGLRLLASGYDRVSLSGAVNLGVAPEVTVSVWMRRHEPCQVRPEPNDTCDAAASSLVTSSDDWGGRYFTLSVGPAAGQIGYRVVGDVGIVDRIAVTSLPDDDAWHSVVLRARDEDFTLFVDGVQVDYSDEEVGNFGAPSTSNLVVGHPYSRRTYSIDLSEIILWDKLLSNGDINKIYSESSLSTFWAYQVGHMAGSKIESQSQTTPGTLAVHVFSFSLGNIAIQSGDEMVISGLGASTSVSENFLPISSGNSAVPSTALWNTDEGTLRLSFTSSCSTSFKLSATLRLPWRSTAGSRVSAAIRGRYARGVMDSVALVVESPVLVGDYSSGQGGDQVWFRVAVASGAPVAITAISTRARGTGTGAGRICWYRQSDTGAACSLDSAAYVNCLPDYEIPNDETLSVAYSDADAVYLEAGKGYCFLDGQPAGPGTARVSCKLGSGAPLHSLDTHANANLDAGVSFTAGGVQQSSQLCKWSGKLSFTVNPAVLTLGAASISVPENIGFIGIPLVLENSMKLSYRFVATIAITPLSGSADDVSSTSAHVMFDIGETTKTVWIGIVDDTITEDVETLAFSIGNVYPKGAVLISSQPQGTIYIEANDVPSPSPSPSVAPSASPSVAPSASPSVVPSASPSVAPSASPSVVPSASPSVAPSASPSVAPSASPSVAPSASPSVAPSASPSVAPSASPSAVPSASPSVVPSASPSVVPSASPSVAPSASPSAVPSASPSVVPSASPSVVPSASPSVAPSASPSVAPSASPSVVPSASPSVAPSASPSVPPSASPSVAPSASPSVAPSASPSVAPSASPSVAPSASPSVVPSASPSVAPSASPSVAPSASPSVAPSASPSVAPSASPSAVPSASPSVVPSASPSVAPSASPSVAPSASPSVAPSANPSVVPSASPSAVPSASPSVLPSSTPSPTPTLTPTPSPFPSPHVALTACGPPAETSEGGDPCAVRVVLVPPPSSAMTVSLFHTSSVFSLECSGDDPAALVFGPESVDGYDCIARGVRDDASSPHNITGNITAVVAGGDTYEAGFVEIVRVDCIFPQVLSVYPEDLPLLGGAITVEMSQVIPSDLEVTVTGASVNVTAITDIHTGESFVAMRRRAAVLSHNEVDRTPRDVAVELQVKPDRTSGTGKVSITVSNNGPGGGSVTISGALQLSERCPSEGQVGKGLDCRDCPDGAVCANGGVVSIANGFWASPDDPTVVIACSPSDACTDGLCATGYKGFACSECSNNWFKSTQGCEPCNAVSTSVVMVAADIGFMTALVVVILFAMETTITNTMMLFAVLGTIRSLAQVDVTGLPSWVGGVVSVAALASGDSLSYIRPECIETNAIGGLFRFFATVVLDLSLRLVLLAAIPLHRYSHTYQKRARAAGVDPNEWFPVMIKSRLIRGNVALLTYHFLALATRSLEMLVCTRVGDTGPLRLDVAPSVLCFSKAHSTAFSLAICILVLLIFFVTGLTVFVTRRRAQLWLHDLLLLRFGCLWEAHRDPLYAPYLYWMLLALAIITAGLRDTPSAYLASLAVFFPLNAAFFLTLRPFRRRYKNVISIVGFTLLGAGSGGLLGAMGHVESLLVVLTMLMLAAAVGLGTVAVVDKYKCHRRRVSVSAREANGDDAKERCSDGDGGAIGESKGNEEEDKETVSVVDCGSGSGSAVVEVGNGSCDIDQSPARRRRNRGRGRGGSTTGERPGVAVVQASRGEEEEDNAARPTHRCMPQTRVALTVLALVVAGFGVYARIAGCLPPSVSVAVWILGIFVPGITCAIMLGTGKIHPGDMSDADLMTKVYEDRCRLRAAIHNGLIRAGSTASLEDAAAAKPITACGINSTSSHSLKAPGSSRRGPSASDSSDSDSIMEDLAEVEMFRARPNTPSSDRRRRHIEALHADLLALAPEINKLMRTEAKRRQDKSTKSSTRLTLELPAVAPPPPPAPVIPLQGRRRSQLPPPPTTPAPPAPGPMPGLAHVPARAMRGQHHHYRKLRQRRHSLIPTATRSHSWSSVSSLPSPREASEVSQIPPLIPDGTSDNATPRGVTFALPKSDADTSGGVKEAGRPARSRTCSLSVAHEMIDEIVSVSASEETE